MSLVNCPNGDLSRAHPMCWLFLENCCRGNHSIYRSNCPGVNYFKGLLSWGELSLACHVPETRVIVLNNCFLKPLNTLQCQVSSSIKISHLRNRTTSLQK